MARVIPKNQLDIITFFQTHGPEWLASHEELGLSEEQAQAIIDATASARALYLEAVAARSAAAVATLRLSDELARLTALGGNAVATIKATARQASAPNTVYSAARIESPKKPSYTAVPPPRTGDVRLTPRPDNGLELRWESDLSTTGATFYTVRRTVAMRVGERHRVAGESDTIGIVRGGLFIDTTLPVGFVSVEYTVTPVRQRGGGRSRGVAEGRPGVAVYTPGAVVNGSAASAGPLSAAA